MDRINKKLTEGKMRRILAGVKPLSQVLREWREEMGLSQAEAGERCGIGQMHWSYLERGMRTPRLENLRKLAAGTGIPLERLGAAAALEGAIPA